MKRRDADKRQRELERRMHKTDAIVFHMEWLKEVENGNVNYAEDMFTKEWTETNERFHVELIHQMSRDELDIVLEYPMFDC